MPALIYYPDDRPGIQRKKCGRGFTYIAHDGTTISDRAERRRLAALAVPPAYNQVWICPYHNGHLQATGRDGRGRKQYKYHADWAAERAKTKFQGLPRFGHALPRIRRKIRQDLSKDVGQKAFALASAVALIDRLSLRVGNSAYTRENGSYGAITLESKHLSLEDNSVQLRYAAKGGHRVQKQVTDQHLARILHKIGDLPGGTLLTWLDSAGQPQPLHSDALNTYLAEAAGYDGATAKTFRTWAGTVEAFAVAKSGSATITEMAEAAAKRLHNTAAIARNSYIHPKVIDLAKHGIDLPPPLELNDLRVMEQALLAYLEL